MEEKRLKEDYSCRRENDERKQPYTHRDIKRKLSFIKKKVDDLQHQRKIAYKNSVKVKRVVHNQINQIVKCLRSRERFLWSEIDEMYLSQDEKISQELLRLHSIHSNCQTLFDHLEDNPQNAKNLLSKIHSSLIRVNYEEKSNGKALEFASDFETLKTKASEFGILADFSFPKGDDFVFIDNDSSSNITCENSHYFRKLYEGSLRQYLKENESSSKEHLSVKTDLEDLFEVVTLNDVSSGESEKDFHMTVNNNFETDCVDIEKILLSTTTNLRKDSNKFENAQNALKDFNPEEEWKQLYELKDRVLSIYDMLPKLGSESSSSENQNATSSNSNAAKSSNEFVYLSPNEVDDWLPRKRAKKDKVSNNKCTSKSKCLSSLDGLLKKNSELEKNNLAKSCDHQSRMFEIRQLSPAEIVQAEFSKYFVKDGIENWLSHN